MVSKNVLLVLNTIFTSIKLWFLLTFEICRFDHLWDVANGTPIQFLYEKKFYLSIVRTKVKLECK